jgi:hypothetical protein
MAVRKPLAQVRRVALFQREILVRLTGPAIDLLFDAAETLSEGERRGDGWYGSTMITIDLARVASVVREECDVLDARQVATLLATDARVAKRARAMAAADAEVRAGTAMRDVKIDLRARAAGTIVHLDCDVEAVL